MLNTLTIQNFVIIDSLNLSFAKGMTALTGETGAGKSILLDALGIILGHRSDVALIRKGCDQAFLAAEFSLSIHHPALALLQEQGIPTSETLVIRRSLANNGKNRILVNDQPVTVTFLRSLGELLVEVHGQFDRLMDVSSHRRILDEYMDQPSLKHSARLAYRTWQEAVTAQTQAEERLDHLKRHEDFLRYQLKEIEALSPEEGEEEQLLEKRQSLLGISKLFESVGSAHGSLEQAQVLSALQTAHRSLQKHPGGENDHIDQATTALEKALSEATEAMAQLEEILGQVDDQPQQLQRIDDRLHALRAIARKHNVTTTDLPQFYGQLKQDLDDLDQAETRAAELARQADRCKQEFLKQAHILSKARNDKALELSAAVMSELPELKLPNAKFTISLTPLEETAWSEQGIDKVNFLVAMNKGQDWQPSEKAASGGELARLMLALKAILATRSTVNTIIFDEIDIGVGGAVAAALGQRLSRLAQHLQVLTITHSPQVAATADAHFQVSKEDQGSQVLTNVIQLPLARRHEEIARMLSGEVITDEARAAARSLLARFG
ncbi:MAG: DNA repair protein RecN [Candidatus Paracaedibacteraceae bacterium]|nr:DNA repair protein RecN [Candidatus Paracaedibacteraceae bacterium]